MTLHYLTIAEASELIRNHMLSPVELTRAFLERIEALDDELHAYITLTGDLAMESAKVAENAILKGDYRGPLHGIPVAHKDLYATEGIRTTAHSRILLEWVPEEDATTVSSLKQAGTVLLGKLAMHEFASGGPPTEPFPSARNPWNLDHVPAGSSSGSAVAVAAGLCMGSLGSDTGGSIRNPASRCGIVGLNPTHGLVSRYGVLLKSESFDRCGPMTRTVQDTALMLQSIAGYDPKDPASIKAPVPDYSLALTKDVAGLVLGIPRRHFFEADIVEPETLAAAENAIQVLEGLGARTKVVDMPGLEHLVSAMVCIEYSEAYAYHEAELKRRPNDFGETVRNSLLVGASYSAVDYVQAQRVRTQISRDFDQVMRQVDALITPTMERPAERFIEYDAPGAMLKSVLTRPSSFTGHPAISLCCGFSADGLPIGLQIVGRAFDEPTILSVAQAYERNTPWHQKRPPIDGLARRTDGQQTRKEG